VADSSTFSPSRKALLENIRHALVLLNMEHAFARVVSIYKYGGPDMGATALSVFHRLVERRRRMFAKSMHPDTGGNTTTMQTINAACDILLNLRVKTL
jgi:hypothetical protein